MAVASMASRSAAGLAASLPTEILTDIFEHVVHHGYACEQSEDHISRGELEAQRNLARCATVSQHWQRASITILYRRVALVKTHQLHKLHETLKRHSLWRHLPISLKVRLRESSTADSVVLHDLLFMLSRLRSCSIDVQTEKARTKEELDLIECGCPSSRQRTPLQFEESDSVPFPALPNSIETLTLSGVGVHPFPLSFELPNLTRLSLRCTSIGSLDSIDLSACANLKHVILNDPVDSVMRTILAQCGNHLVSLELLCYNWVDEAVFIDQNFEKALPNLQMLSLRGNFLKEELLHIPSSLKRLAWRGASDATVINDFLQELCDASFLPNLEQFPEIHQLEEVRYSRPGVRKVSLRKATDALHERGIDVSPAPHQVSWNEVRIFPRARSLHAAEYSV